MMQTSILKRFFCVALALVLCFGIVGSHGVTLVKAEGEKVVTFDAIAQEYANATEFKTITIDGVTFTGNKGSNSNTPKYYTSGTAIRFYGGNTLTISVEEGYQISTIEITQSDEGTHLVGKDVTAPNTTISGTTFTATIPMDTVVITVGGTSGNWRFQKCVVTCTPVSAETPEDRPLAEVADGNYYISTAKTEGTYLSSVKAGDYNQGTDSTTAHNAEIWKLATVVAEGENPQKVTTIASYKNNKKLGTNGNDNMVADNATYVDWTVFKATEDEEGVYLGVDCDGTYLYMQYNAENNTWHLGAEEQLLYLVSNVTVVPLEFSTHSLELSSYLHIRYYVDLTGIDTTKVVESGYQIWDYSLGETVPEDTTDVTISAENLNGFEVSGDGEYYVSNGGIVAKNITKQYYIRAYVKLDSGKVIYTDVEEYSVYAYQTLVNNSASYGPDSDLGVTVQALIDYGVAAAKLLVK